MTEEPNDSPTPTECALTAALTVCILNLKQLYSDYERLAADNDLIPDPMIETAIRSTMSIAADTIAQNDHLAKLSKKITTDYIIFATMPKNMPDPTLN